MSRDVHRLGPHCYLWHKPIISIFGIFVPKVIDNRYWPDLKKSLILADMERLSRTLPWDHPAARELDRTVHKRRMQGEFVFFVSSTPRAPKSPFLSFYRHVLDTRSLLLRHVLLHSLQIKVKATAQTAISLSILFVFFTHFQNPLYSTRMWRMCHYGSYRSIWVLTFFRCCPSTWCHACLVFTIYWSRMVC